jgi:hypothetical protein
MVLTIAQLNKMYSTSGKILKLVERIVKAAKNTGKLSPRQRESLSALVLRSQLLHKNASNAYHSLVENEKEFIVLAGGRKSRTPFPTTMLKEIIENHRWIGKHLTTHEVEGKPFLEHLAYGRKAFPQKFALRRA